MGVIIVENHVRNKVHLVENCGVTLHKKIVRSFIYTKVISFQMVSIFQHPNYIPTYCYIY